MGNMCGGAAEPPEVTDIDDSCERPTAQACLRMPSSLRATAPSPSTALFTCCSTDQPPLGAPTPGNPIVFFDVSAGGSVIGTIEMELKMDVTPKTCENFKQLCTGESASSAGGVYKGAPFHRIIPNFMCQGGGQLQPKNLHFPFISIEEPSFSVEEPAFSIEES